MVLYPCRANPVWLDPFCRNLELAAQAEHEDDLPENLSEITDLWNSPARTHVRWHLLPFRTADCSIVKKRVGVILSVVYPSLNEANPYETTEADITKDVHREIFHVCFFCLFVSFAPPFSFFGTLFFYLT